MVVSAPTSVDAKPDGDDGDDMTLMISGINSDTLSPNNGAQKERTRILSTRYVNGVGEGTSLIVVCPMLTPRLDFAFGSFAILAKATANSGTMDAHPGSILAASMMCLIAVAKQSSAVALVEGDVMFSVMITDLGVYF
jgi:hypothetical protein